jgi:clan AA aspartic protease
MIAGTVTDLREASIRLTVIGPGGVREVVEAVLDTGFNGFLTLARTMVQALRLPLAGTRRATLADGSIVALDVYLAIVQCHEEEREVLALQSEGGALVGMSLLYGSRVVLHVVEDGDVLIEPLALGINKR